MAPDVEREILERVRMNRRGFVRKVIVGTAFATPVLASFDMRSMTAYAADCQTANQTSDLEDDKFRIDLLGCTVNEEGRVRLRLKVRNADNDNNVSSADLKVKLIDIE